MKIGALCCEDYAGPSIIAQEFYDKGVDIVELVYNSTFTSDEIKKIKEYGLDLSMHCPFGSLIVEYSLKGFLINRPRFYFSKPVISMIEKSFSVAEKLGATHYVLHGGSFPRGYYRFKRLRRNKEFVKAFIKSFGHFFIKHKDSSVKIVLENLVYGNMFAQNSEIIEVQKKFPWIGFCWDFAHSELSDQTKYLAGLDFEHVHVSDNNLKYDDHLDVGKGQLDFSKMFYILNKREYNNKIIAECKSVNDGVESINFLGRVRLSKDY